MLFSNIFLTDKIYVVLEKKSKNFKKFKEIKL